MYPHPSPLRAKLIADQCVTGIYIQTHSADCVEIAGDAGFDYVIIDQEHGAFGFGETVQMIRAAEAAGVCPIVRVPDQNPTHLRMAVEAGALGVYVPNIRTAEEARQAIAAVRFAAPGVEGVRGACPTIRAVRGGGAEWGKFVAWSNANVMVTLLIESQEGFDNLDAILAVPGIDVIVLGRFDLAHELGLYGDRYGTMLTEMFAIFSAKAKKAGVPYVARLSGKEPAAARAEYQDLVAQGARIFNAGSDREFIASAFRNALLPMRAEA